MVQMRIIIIGCLIGIGLGALILLAVQRPLSIDGIKAEYAAAKPVMPLSDVERNRLKDSLRLVTKANDEAAVLVIGRLALDGYPEAQSMVGSMYWSGRGFPKNNEEAVRWYRLAANQGDSFAQRYMGISYLTGTGVAVDEPGARNWFLRAAERGDATAQTFAGQMLIEGKGGAADYALGLHWLSRAADQGDQFAKANLAELERIDRKSNFDAWVQSVAASQGGQISLRQMAMLAQIYRSGNGGAPAGNSPYSGIMAAPTAPALLPIVPTRPGASSRDVEGDDGGYRGTSGKQYQYDLSKPSDQLRYSVDPDAQLHDSINIDPRVELDRGLGQYGGGIQP